jgi:D-arginine dehydrogenase
VIELSDILVIGGGIAGASAAYELSKSASVIVLERESQPGYHTTGRSAAVYTQNYGNREIRILTRAGLSLFENLPEEFGDSPVLEPRGALFIAREDQLPSLEAAIDEEQSSSSAVRRVDKAEAIEINSSLNPDYVAAGVYEPDARDIDVHSLHGGFLKGLKQHGGKVITNSDVTALRYRDGVWTIETSAGTFQAPIVVNAAGAWCDVIAEMAGVSPVGLMPKRRTIFTFDPPVDMEISHWPLTIDIDEEFYFKPDAGRILASPADETLSPPCDAQPEELDVAIAADKVQTATTLEVRRIVNKWAGLRSFVADKTPVIGLDDQADGFFWLAGQGGYGIQTSPAIGRVVAELIAHNRMPADMKAMGLTAADLSSARLR